MAMDYTATGHFKQLGKIVLIWNQFRDLTRELTFASGSDLFHSLDTLLEETLGVFNATTEDRRLADRINSDVRSFMATVDGSWAEALKAWADDYLVRVIAPALDIADTEPANILTQLALDMRANSESVDGNAVTVAATGTAASHNAGTAVVRASALDREGDTNQLVRAQTITVACTADAPFDGRTAGEETLSARAEPVDPSDGSGGEVSLDLAPATAADAANDTNRVDNGNFESITSNVPDGWTAENGTAGTHILEETSEVYLGSKSIEFAGDGAQAVIGISFDLSALDPELKPWTVYALNAFIKTSGLTQGGITLKLAGTDMSDLEAQSVASSWPTTWTAIGGFVTLPKLVPSDLKLEIEITGTPDASSHVYVDNVALVEAVELPEAGVYLAAFQGDAHVVAGDKPDAWTLACTSDEAGRFQIFLRDLYNRYLPFDTGGSETIADSLTE